MIGNLVLRLRASGVVNVISERKSDHIPPKMKRLNMVVPILMRFYSLVLNWSVASCIKPHRSVRHPTKCFVINVQLFPTVHRRMSGYKSKCIRIYAYCMEPYGKTHLIETG